MPKCVAMNNVIDPAHSAANPLTGFSLRDSLAHRLHDAPAAEHRADADREESRSSRPTPASDSQS
jgi:hypothetical protein